MCISEPNLIQGILTNPHLARKHTTFILNNLPRLEIFVLQVLQSPVLFKIIKYRFLLKMFIDSQVGVFLLNYFDLFQRLITLYDPTNVALRPLLVRCRNRHRTTSQCSVSSQCDSIDSSDALVSIFQNGVYSKSLLMNAKIPIGRVEHFGRRNNRDVPADSIDFDSEEKHHFGVRTKSYGTELVF